VSLEANNLPVIETLLPPPPMKVHNRVQNTVIGPHETTRVGPRPHNVWMYEAAHYRPVFLISLWDCASRSNIAIIQRFQSKPLRATVNTPWYITNAIIHSDLSIPTVQDVIHKRSSKHRTKLQSHPNQLLQSPSRDSIPRRLKRRWSTDL
jgi:hypothetical protein